MTKKHYTAIASIMLSESMNTPYGYRKEISNKLANFFEQDNPKFDRERFLSACGINEPRN